MGPGEEAKYCVSLKRWGLFARSLREGSFSTFGAPAVRLHGSREGGYNGLGSGRSSDQGRLNRSLVMSCGYY